jgi:hypothetical protein
LEENGVASLFGGGSDMFAGPYPTKDACEQANPGADAKDSNYFCSFEGTDPNSSDSQ